MKKLVKGIVGTLAALAASASFAFTVDTEASPGPVSGHWWNPAEPGWGLAIQQQYETLFVQLYTYNKDGLPIWYVASCKLDNTNKCTANLYTAVGGAPLPYYEPATAVLAGQTTLTFVSNDVAAFQFKIGDGVAWTKDIVKMIFDNTKP